MKEYDTIVIGAGPVGSYVAHKLTQSNYEVLVIDKKASPSDDVCCTGILSKECLDTFRIDHSLVLRESKSANFFSPSEQSLRLWRNEPVAAIVDRPALNLNLAKRAQESGADYLFGVRATDISTEDSAVHITTSSKDKVETYKSKTVVIAAGFGSGLPEKLGLGKIKHFLSGAQAEVNTSVDEVEIYFNQDLTPNGFAWLVPTRAGKGLAGVLTRHQADYYLKSFLNTLSSYSKIASTEAIPQYGVIPLKPLVKTYTARVLIVGEAAGQVKPTTGGGVYYGLLCADIAANVIRQAFLIGNFSATLLSAYQKQWHARLSRELTVGYWARYFYNCLNNRSIDYLFSYAAKHGIAEIVAKSKDPHFDWHSRLFIHILRSLLPFTNASLPL